MKKIISIVMVGFIAMVGAKETTFANEKIYKLNETNITINGVKIHSNEPPLSINGRILIPIRVVSQHLDGEVQWDNSKKKVLIITKDRDVLEISMKQNIISINGIMYQTDSKLIIFNNRVYLPIRLTGEVNHAEVEYTKGNVRLQKRPLHIVNRGESIYTIAQKYGVTAEDIITRNGLSDDKVVTGQHLKIIVPYVVRLEVEKVQLLAKLIESEAKGESAMGKLAVGNVVVNRVNNPKFPNTVKEVIYQKNQFAPVTTGKIKLIKASESSIEAAKKALNGENVAKDALYFYNPNKTTSTFFKKLNFIMKIGNHTFLK